MRIKNKEIRRRRHRKEQVMKAAARETRAKYAGKPAAAPAEKVVSKAKTPTKKVEAAAKPKKVEAAAKPKKAEAAAKPKKVPAKKKVEEPASE